MGNFFVLLLICSIILAIPAMVIAVLLLRSDKQLWAEIQIMALENKNSTEGDKEVLQ
ncbi:hypothetical protein [Marinobacter sp. tcs-11]|uniref:hypothetical protein n=1 Tax=Marinobacter sp. tcs-11 TaxID=1742860 RepID=UPI00257FAA7A|nr:hypothetical protein [Marinobacter sp. tcs-11]